jgi:ParB-like chromosome segregation protein Spo0J
MEYHEYANIYRMLPEKELQALADDMKAKGQLLHITSYEGKILDGRNRYRACEIAGIEPKIEPYTGDDPLGLISSLNDHRRHDSDNERALVGARMANLKKGANQHSSMETPSEEVVSIDRAAELSGSTPASIKRAKAIVESGIPELHDMVESGEVSVRAGSAVASLPPDEQRKAVAGGVQGVKDAAKKLSNTKKKSLTSSPPPEPPSNSQSTQQTSGSNGSAQAESDCPTPEPGVAMVYARTALDALNKIPKKDPSRNKAIAMIAEWLTLNTKTNNK